MQNPATITCVIMTIHVSGRDILAVTTGHIETVCSLELI